MPEGISFTRTAEAAEGVGTISTSIPIGAGAWLVTGVHVILGGSVSVVVLGGASMHGTGDVRFENLQQQDGSLIAQKAAQRLVAGHCTLLQAIILEKDQIVVGPGRIRSYIETPDSVAHTLTVTYRRLSV